MRCTFIIDRAISENRIAGKILSVVRKFRVPCIEDYRSAKSIRPVINGRRTVKYFHTLEHKLVYRNRILQMSATINKVIHPYSVNNKQNTRSLKPSYNRTSSTLLALLNSNHTCFLKHITYILTI